MTELLPLIAILVTAYGAWVAFRRFRVADKNRLEDQFIIGAKLLDYKAIPTAYVGRTAGAVALADLALKEPDDYDERVMRVFQAFLDFPPRYGENHEHEGQVDYTSIDTVTIVETIAKRQKGARDRYPMRLTRRRPFRVNAEGNVEPNPEYDDPALRPAKVAEEGSVRFRPPLHPSDPAGIP